MSPSPPTTGPLGASRSHRRLHLATQRDLYAYLHDQTLRYINQGYTGSEIAEIIELPPALERAWSTRGYYGSVSHNVKAVYQRYMGWFDANPGRLWPHPPHRTREPVRRGDGRTRPSRQTRPNGLRVGRLPLGGDPAGPRRLRRPGPRCRHAPSTPTPWNSSATAPRMEPGGIFSFRAPRNSAESTSAPRQRRQHPRFSPSSLPNRSSIHLRSRSTDPRLGISI